MTRSVIGPGSDSDAESAPIAKQAQKTAQPLASGFMRFTFLARDERPENPGPWPSEPPSDRKNAELGASDTSKSHAA